MAFTSVNSKELEARYWFDSDSGNINTCMVESGSIELPLPVEGLPNKVIHQLNFQIKGSNGQWSGIYSGFFTVGQTAPLQLSYDIDGQGTYSPIDLTNPQINGEELADGVHHITVVEENGNLLPTNRLFFKNSGSTNNLTLSLESSRDNVRKTIELPAGTNEAEISVSDIPVGIYPMTANLKDGQSRLVKSVSSLVNIKPVGGERVTGLYYWLNDSVGESKEILIPDGTLPLSYSVDLDMSDLSVPTTDYTVAVDEAGLKITPNFNVGVAVMSNRGFRADTTSYYKDNGKVEPVVPVILQSGVQYDFGEVTPQDVLWAQIPVQENDRVQFMPRWESTVKLFDNNAVAVDTTVFDTGIIKTTFTSGSNGNYYAQIYDIAESVRDFSVKMNYLAGPSASASGNDKPEYEGIPVVWNSPEDWAQAEDELSLAKDGVTLNVYKSESAFMPVLTNQTNLCHTYQGNKLEFSSEGYIERITLCLPDGLNIIPRVTTSEGTIKIDAEANIIVWEGLSNRAEMTIGNFYSSEVSDEMLMPEVMLTCAYVKISDIDESVYVDETNMTQDFEYEEYNYIRIWVNGKQIAEHWIDNDTHMTFDDKHVILAHDTKQDIYEVNPTLVITYSKESTVGVSDPTAISEPIVKIIDKNIVVNDLPNFVGIYSLDGRTIFQQNVDAPFFSYPIEEMVPGIYIVKVGEMSTKMMIK